MDAGALIKREDVEDVPLRYLPARQVNPQLLRGCIMQRDADITYIKQDRLPLIQGIHHPTPWAPFPNLSWTRARQETFDGRVTSNSLIGQSSWMGPMSSVSLLKCQARAPGRSWSSISSSS